MNDEPSPLEDIRRKLALPLGENAVFDGWTEAAVVAAARAQGVEPAQAKLAVPKDQAGKIDLYIRGVDRALADHFTPERLEGLKIREKIRAIVW
jgi:ubiquinone biosynthesis protein COQ9